MDELTYTIQFIKFYSIFTIIMILFDVSSAITIFPTFPEITSLSFSNILLLAGSVGKFLLSLFFYSIPNFAILNLLLWSSRVIAMLEILMYIKRLINPVSN